MDAWRSDLLARYAGEADPVVDRVELRRDSLPDPERVWSDLRIFLEAQEDERGALRRLREDPLTLDLLLILGGTSRYGFETALRPDGGFWAITGERQFRQVWGKRLLAAQLTRETVEAATAAARLAAIAAFKHRHWLRVMLGDLAGALPLEAVVRELSDLTDVLVQACLDVAVREVAARAPAGVDARAPAFAVLGMGKLGARELNYSSDIDLIFLYGPPPATSEDAEGGSEDADAHTYYQRLGAALIRHLADAHVGGPMFRVDMRLRPEGDRGELVLSVREMIDYYYSVGRPWERQAMIKVRGIAGHPTLPTQLLDELTPWIYPREPQWEDLEEARAMRRRIEERAQAANVKTGAGGIRDIEFLVQYFQLVHGGRAPELRLGATLPVLRLLVDSGLLPAAAGQTLEQAYLFLRMVEHRLQLWLDRQEHEVPAAAAERLLVARRSGFTGPQALAIFDQRLLQVRTRVRELVAHHFLGVTSTHEALLALVVQGEADERLARQLLTPYNLRDPLAASARVRQLAVEPFFVLSRNRTERTLVQLLPALLTRIAASPDPDQTLENLGRIVSAVGGRATFYELLLDRPQVLRLIVDLAGWATYLVALMQDFPGLPDDVIDALNQARRRPHEFSAQARALVQGIREVGPPLAYLVARETAIIAIRELEDHDARRAARDLTLLARAILETALARVLQERARAHGIPVEGGRPTRFAVLGLGKLGGGELSYASDMDVIFVCDPGGVCSRGSGEPLQGDVFWTKVAEDLMRLMSEHRLYELDPRLRPYGEQSELVATTEALRIYWSQERDLWERMAMLRVDHLAGDPRLGEEASRAILTAALGAAVPADARVAVVAMRRRLEESVAGRDHLKRGRGGYVDHEFIAQFAALGLAPGQLPRPASTAATLQRLGELGRIPPQAAQELIAGLERLRWVESRMRLAAGRAVSSIPTEFAARTELARRCGYASVPELDAELAQVRRQGRAWFERLIGPVA